MALQIILDIDPTLNLNSLAPLGLDGSLGG